MLYVVLVKLGVQFNLALALVYCVGIVVGFLINKNWTFSGTRSHSQRTMFVRYLASYAMVFTSNLLLLNVLVHGLGLNPIVGQLVALLVATLLSFTLQRNWVFKGVDISH